MLRRSTAWLEKRGIESPRFDVELLMAHALGVKRLDLYLQFDRPLEAAETAPLRELVQRRSEGEPVAYLVGHKDFFSLPFAVDARVLVPRPETELLVEHALARLSGAEAGVRVADVGTGSGCIVVSLLHALPEATGVATDVSGGALEVAAANAETHGVRERLTLLRGDALGPLAGREAVLDAVLSNPPYIVRGDPDLAPDVAAHEPEDALYVPGDDPNELVERIAREALPLLRPGGFVAFEVGHTGAQDAAARLTALGYTAVEITPDLAGIERIVTGVRDRTPEG